MNTKIIEKLVILLLNYLDRFPWVAAVVGFVSGTASFFMVQRNDQLAKVLTLLMLASWVWLTLEKYLNQGFWYCFRINVPRPVLRFAAQLVHQESLFFVLPFFLITTSWNSGQALFTSALVVAAIISIIDPLYHHWLAARKWLYFLFHGITLFALLLTALPIIFHLPTSQSYLWALLVASAVSLPSIAQELPSSWREQSGAVLLLIASTTSLGWWAQPWIPPATLWLTTVAISDHFDDERRGPDSQIDAVSARQLQAGLYAFTAIHAPLGLHERIYHVWYRDGEEVDRIALDISGGRAEGYRAWTHKVNFPEQLGGKWTIRVVTGANQLIGLLRFRVLESAVQLSHEPLPGSDKVKITTGL